LVVGATYPDELARVRQLAPHAPLLIPGVGAQGGDAQATVSAAWRADAPIVVSSSRAVLYAGKTIADFAAAARRAALEARTVLTPPAP
jgi:orotidine-5'-phosphate decarboxylase